MSLLKGFLSLFDWMFPSKSYQELSYGLDNKMQDFYNRMGWGKYNNPLNNHWYAKYLRGEPVEYHGTISELEKLLNSYKPGQFIPYAVYNKQDDALTAHFKDGEYVSILLNDTVTIFKSFYGGEIIGCRINNINFLTK